MAFSVMMKEVDGEMRGFKARPFDYSGTLLVGPKKYATRQRQELADVLALKKGDFTKYDAKEAVKLEIQANLEYRRLREKNDELDAAIKAKGEQMPPNTDPTASPTAPQPPPPPPSAP